MLQNEIAAKLYKSFLIGINAIQSVSVDSSGKEAFNGIFGDRFVAQRLPAISSNFNYPVDTRKITTTVINSATAGLSGNLLSLVSGINAAGSCSIQTKESLRYQAGRDGEIMFTALYDTGVANNTRKIGLYDPNDGFWIGYVGIDFGVGIRKNTADIFIKKSDWNYDKLDGNGNSKFTIDTTKMNIYRITYGYLGVAPVIYQVYGGIEKGWITFHVYDVANKQTGTHIASPYLPIRVENTNTGNTTSVKIQSGSIYCGTIDGAGTGDSSSREFSRKISMAGVTAGADKVIIIFHNKTTLGGVTNKVQDLLTRIGIGVDGTKTVNITLYKLSAVPTGTIFTDVDTANSNMETSTAGVISLVGSEILASWSLGKTDSTNIDVSKDNLILNPNEYAVFTFTSTGTSDIEFSNRWSELF